MNKVVMTTVALLVAAGLAAAQSQDQDHKAHHPESAASVPLANAPEKAATAPPAKGADMAAKMKAMQDMHQKMMDAKTPAERQALMGEHMKAMQSGMDMMKMNRKGMSADPKARMEAMEQRMEMMQTMMEMMMDRMPAVPAQGSN